MRKQPKLSRNIIYMCFILFSSCSDSSNKTDNDITEGTDTTTEGTDTTDDTPSTNDAACDDSWGMYDSQSGLCWQKTKDDGFYDWYEATDACKALRIGGHEDWRLPTRSEIIALLGECDDTVLNGGEGQCGACIDSCEMNCHPSERCLAVLGYDEDYYWTSDEEGEDKAWWALFLNGSVDCWGKDAGFPLRCTRTARE